MLKRLTTALMALVVSFGALTASAPQAEARRGFGAGVGLGVAAGIIGLGALSAAAHANGPRYYSRYDDGEVCYRGPRECHWAGRRCFENDWGEVVCRGGRYVCDRPLICD